MKGRHVSIFHSLYSKYFQGGGCKMHRKTNSWRHVLATDNNRPPSELQNPQLHTPRITRIKQNILNPNSAHEHSSKLSLSLRLLIDNFILKPSRTYCIELWACKKPFNYLNYRLPNSKS